MRRLSRLARELFHRDCIRLADVEGLRDELRFALDDLEAERQHNNMLMALIRTAPEPARSSMLETARTAQFQPTGDGGRERASADATKGW